jgi:hypothetical protein
VRCAPYSVCEKMDGINVDTWGDAVK